MYESKAIFFDSQADAPWAADEYGLEEKAKLDRLFSVTGPLDGMTVLEPGCGTGRLTEILAQKVGPAGLVLAMDISASMVAAARARVAGHPHVGIHHGELERSPLPEGEVDLALCHQVFPHLEDKERAVTLLARSLKREGMLILCHFITLAAINDVHRKAGTAVEKDMMPDKDEMRRLFTAAGLTIDFVTDDERGYFLCARKV